MDCGDYAVVVLNLLPRAPSHTQDTEIFVSRVLTGKEGKRESEIFNGKELLGEDSTLSSIGVLAIKHDRSHNFPSHKQTNTDIE
jgi:hypothetical protein